MKIMCIRLAPTHLSHGWRHCMRYFNKCHHQLKWKKQNKYHMTWSKDILAHTRFAITFFIRSNSQACYAEWKKMSVVFTLRMIFQFSNKKTFVVHKRDSVGCFLDLLKQTIFANYLALIRLHKRHWICALRNPIAIVQSLMINDKIMIITKWKWNQKAIWCMAKNAEKSNDNKSERKSDE